MRRLVLRLIVAYRATGGSKRWFGLECHFEPTCSAYAEAAIARYGLRRGTTLARERLRRCRRRDSICKCLEPLPGDAVDAATRGH